MEMEIAHRAHGRRRDRHGRGPRGPIFPPILPGALTRSEKFDRLVADVAAHLLRLHPSLKAVEFGVEEVPPSDPAAWERETVAVGRYFPEDRALRMPARIVIYRRPVLVRAFGPEDVADFVRLVVTEQVAEALGMHPEDVDPYYRIEE
ncbi:MAG: metallopeptidase family protein [Ruaniaceae bacterium]|nr:metallopeptidase family protein [Ruaniaceae bacterium]